MQQRKYGGLTHSLSHSSGELQQLSTHLNILRLNILKQLRGLHLRNIMNTSLVQRFYLVL